MPFTWMRYKDDSKTFLDEVHLKAEFEVPFEFPHVESVLVWGDPAVGHVTIEQINTAFEGPQGLKQLIHRVGAAKCQCSASMCGGHGRCYGVGVGGYAACECFEGFSGVNCTTKTGRVVAEPASTLHTGSATICPDGISSCAGGQTCGQFVGGRWGCCPLPNAVLCNQHCCPAGYACDPVAGVCYQP